MRRQRGGASSMSARWPGNSAVRPTARTPPASTRSRRSTTRCVGSSRLRYPGDPGSAGRDCHRVRATRGTGVGSLAAASRTRRTRRCTPGCTPRTPPSALSNRRGRRGERHSRRDPGGAPAPAVSGGDPLDGAGGHGTTRPRPRTSLSAVCTPWTGGPRPNPQARRRRRFVAPRRAPAAPAQEIAEGVYRLVGVWRQCLLVRSGAAWVLVDAAWAWGGCARVIRRAAETLFGPESRPAAILLTHLHRTTTAPRWSCASMGLSRVPARRRAPAGAGRGHRRPAGSSDTATGSTVGSSCRSCAPCRTTGGETERGRA